MSLGVALSKLKVFAVKETLVYSFIRVIIGPIIGLAFVIPGLSGGTISIKLQEESNRGVLPI